MEVGIDIEEVSRIKKACKKWGNRFLSRIFTKSEIDYCFLKSNPYPSLCGRFSAKEAIIKVYGSNLSFNEIEILNDKDGKPYVLIKGRAMDNLKISISHTKNYAVAVAVLNE